MCLGFPLSRGPRGPCQTSLQIHQAGLRVGAVALFGTALCWLHDIGNRTGIAASFYFCYVGCNLKGYRTFQQTHARRKGVW